VTTSAAHPAQWNTGDVVDGRYQLTRVIGHGGMGVVHRVRHLGWGVDLAVKSLLPKYFVDPQDVESFVAEAKRWVSLGLHPNVCSCYYVRVLDGIPRLFAEYVRGGSLRESIDDGSLYVGDEDDVNARILRISSHMARGLEYAHDRGVLHCDVKPANVLLEGGTDGIAKITDFGISESLAVVLEGRALDVGDLVAPGGGGLTPAYASPEQKRREPLSTRSDIYSFAVSVKEIFSRSAAAYDAATVGPGSSAASADTLEIDSRRMPEPVAELLDRCLDEDPKKRPTSMAEIATRLEALHAALAPDEPKLVPPKPAELRAAEHNNRALSHLDLGGQAEAEIEFRKALDSDPQHLDSTYNIGLLRWRRGEITDTDLLAALDGASLHAGHLPHARALIAQTHLERGDAGCAREILGLVARDHPDDSEIATLTLALESDAIGDVAPARTTPLPWRTDCDSPPYWQVRFSLDGTRLISGATDGTTRLWDASTGECLRSCESSGGWSIRVSSPDGRHGLTHIRGEHTRLWDFTTGRSLRLLSPKAAGSVSALQMSPDCAVAYAVTDDGELYAWNLLPGTTTMRGALVRRFRLGGRGECPLLECSPDGAALLCYHGGLEGRLLVLSPSYAEDVRVLADSCDRVRAMAWTRDSAYAVVADDRQIGVWKVETGRCERRLRPHGAITALAVSADARWALSGQEDGAVCLWDLEELRCLRTLSGHDGPVCDIWLSEDGYRARSVGQDNTVRSWKLKLPVGYRGNLQISRPRRATDLGSFGERARDLIQRADFAIADYRYSVAHELLREARTISGYERDARVLEIWRDLGRLLPRTGLRAAWTVRELPSWDPGEAHLTADLSDDARYTVYGGILKAGIWDMRGNKRLRELPHGAMEVGLSGDGRRVVCVDQNGSINAWSVSAGAEITTIHPLDAQILTAAAVAADGSQVVVARKDHVLELWDVDHKCHLRTFTEHTRRVNALWITPDRQTLASAAVDEVRLWDLASGRCILCIPVGDQDYPRSICVTADRGLIVVGGDGTPGARMWNAAGECVWEFTGRQSRVVAVRFSPDGRFVFVGDMAGAISIWSVSTGTPVHTIETGQDAVVDMRLTPDGRFLLAGGLDGEARLWELDWDFAAPGR
jgi:WD40 repeat protein/tetratricopeptide (TPR) repeat protein